MSELIDRQQAIDKITKRLFETAFNNVGIKQNIDETLVDVAENRLGNWFDELPSAEPDTTTHDSIPAETGKNDGDGTSGDCISRQAAIDKFIDALEEIFSNIREKHVDDSVCGLCEYDGAYIGQSGDWCNECPGFDRDDCFKLSDKTRKKWTDEIIKALPSIQPEHKKGRWIYGESEVGNDGYYCSECGNFVPWIYEESAMNFIREYKFCPNCGAKMEGGD